MRYGEWTNPWDFLEDICGYSKRMESPVKCYEHNYKLIDANIKRVIFNNPATVVYWADGTKTVVKCGKNDTFDPEKGLAMAIAKRVLGNNKGNYNEIFKKWIKEDN